MVVYTIVDALRGSTSRTTQLVCVAPASEETGSIIINIRIFERRSARWPARWLYSGCKCCKLTANPFASSLAFWRAHLRIEIDASTISRHSCCSELRNWEQDTVEPFRTLHRNTQRNPCSTQHTVYSPDEGQDSQSSVLELGRRPGCLPHSINHIHI